jgi:broad specificity phosphatase PhoE
LKNFMKIYFVRHGESETNILNILYNRGNLYGLTKKGRLQVEELGAGLHSIKFTKIITSPLLRAVETAQILSEKLGIMKTEISDSLREIDVGDLDGTGSQETFDKETKVTDEWLLNKKWDCCYPNGDSYMALVQRFDELLQNIVNEDSDNVLLVGHGGIIMCMVPYLCQNISFEYCNSNLLKNADYAVLEYSKSVFRCIRYGGLE